MHYSDNKYGINYYNQWYCSRNVNCGRHTGMSEMTRSAERVAPWTWRLRCLDSCRGLSLIMIYWKNDIQSWVLKKIKMNHHNNHELAEADACSRRIRNALVLCYIMIITVKLFFYVNDVGSEDAICLVISHELDCDNGSWLSSLGVRRRLKCGTWVRRSLTFTFTISIITVISLSANILFCLFVVLVNKI